MSYEKFYPGGWQSGESGGTPITPEALNHIENGIKKTYSDFAPAGYGLGIASWSGGEYENFTDATKLDDLKVNGFWAYQKSGEPLESNYAQTQFVAGYTIANSPGFVTQRAVTLYTGVWIERQFVTRAGGAAWEPWAYVNPPMDLGVEYRTTERWNGKVVYTARIYYGKGSSTGSFNIYTNHVTGLNVMFIDAVCKAEEASGWSEFIVSPNLTFAESGSGSAVFAVRNKGDLSNHDIYLTVKYYKV